MCALLFCLPERRHVEGILPLSSQYPVSRTTLRVCEPRSTRRSDRYSRERSLMSRQETAVVFITYTEAGNHSVKDRPKSSHSERQTAVARSLRSRALAVGRPSSHLGFHCSPRSLFPQCLAPSSLLGAEQDRPHRVGGKERDGGERKAGHRAVPGPRSLAGALAAAAVALSLPGCPDGIVRFRQPFLTGLSFFCSSSYSQIVCLEKLEW